MQPCSREMQAMNTLLNHQQQQQQQQQHHQEQVSLQDLQNHHHHQMQFDPTSSHDDFLEQMLSSINPSSCSPWPDVPGPAAFPSLKSAAADAGGDDQPEQYHFEDQTSAMLVSKLRNHQINNGNGPSAAAAAAAAKALMLQQHLMLSRGFTGNGLRSPTGNNGLLPMPLSLGNTDQNDIVDASFKSTNPANESSVQALYNGFAGSLGQTASHPPHFHHPQGGAMQAQTFAAAAPSTNQAAPPSGSAGAGGGVGTPGQPRQQRVRARRGQATDPHSIAERLRRERIAERMKALQELVPNANKTDKASMLDEIIDYVKFLQLQVKVLSMSRLGGAAAVAPLVADVSSEAGGGGGRSNGTQTATASSSNNDGMTVTEHQVAKLMEEDMGSAMQYLQGKGLCLMPISLATAISTATCQSRNPMNPNNLSSHNNNNIINGNNPLLLGSNGSTTDVAVGGPSSPSMSVLTVQSATLANGVSDASVKDGASVSKS